LEENMDSNAAKGALLGRPAEFLKYYPLKCAGAKAPLQNQVNLKPIYIHKQDGAYITDPKTHKAKIGIMGHTGATRPRMLGPDRKISSFKLNTIHPAGDYAQFSNAHIVPMVHYNSPATSAVDVDLAAGITAMPRYVLDGSGDGLMVTGELSGCCFCWVAQGATLWCIHVQPKGINPATGNAIDGAALHVLLQATGRFHGAPGTAIGTYGANQYGTKRASVVGVRLATGWTLYAQTSSTSFQSVADASRIYPGAVQLL
jgi:hypothetical protein